MSIAAKIRYKNEQMMNEKMNVKMNENLYKHRGRMVLPDEKYIHRPLNLFIPIFLILV